MDFNKLLESLADRTDTKSKKLATPGQVALADMVDKETAPEAIHTPDITAPSMPMIQPTAPEVAAPPPPTDSGSGGMFGKIVGGMNGDAPASGGLGGALGGVAGAIDTSPPNMAMPPSDYAQNPVGQQLAMGSALRQLASGGVVDPGQTVEVGDGGDGSGAEILHVDKDGKAIVTPIAQPDGVAGLAKQLPPNPTKGLPQDYTRPEVANLNRPIAMPVLDTPTPTQSGTVQAQPTTPVESPIPPDQPLTGTLPPSNIAAPPMLTNTTTYQPDGTPMYTAPSGVKYTQGVNDAPVPEQDPEKYYQQKYLDAMSPRPHNKILGALYGALQGVTNEQLGTNAPIKTLDDLRRDRAARQYGPILQAIGQQKAAEEAKAMHDAQIAHLKAQADAARENADTMHDYRQNQHDDKVRQQGDIALRSLLKLKHVDPTNTAQKALMVQAGLNPDDVKGWDDRNPITKQVNGVTYNLNRETGAYEQTNLPKDEAKTLTTYEVTMPDNTKRTYRVSQKDAAGFSTQVTKLGMQIDAANTRQDKTIANDQEKQKALNAYRGAMTDIAKQRVALAANGDARGVARLDEQSKALRARLLERVQQGKLSQEDFDNVFAEDAGFGSASGGVERPQ